MLHVSGYALLDQPSAGAVERACEIARGAGASLSIDLACADIATPLVRERIAQLQPDVALATAAQAEAIGGIDDLADLPVISDDGALPAIDPMGVSDAFAAGFLSALAAGRRRGRCTGRRPSAGRPLRGPRRAVAVTRGFTGLLRLAPEVERALIRSQPVVALETSLVAHGLPHPDGLEVALRCEDRVREAGVVPATIAVVDGAVRVGLDEEELERLSVASTARKVGPRDLAASVVSGGLGATTVAGALAVCRIAGIHFMATGGLGGVHRGWQQTRDVSADTYEIAFAAVCVVCSGVKSLLDVSATLEELETRGIPVIGYGTDHFPLFYRRDSPHPLPDRVDDPATVAALAATHWGFARAAGVVVANPVAEEVALSADEIEPAVDKALAEAEAAGIRGAEVTPFVLGRVHELTEGRSLAANRRLIGDNAALAAEIARAYYAE